MGSKIPGILMSGTECQYTPRSLLYLYQYLYNHTRTNTEVTSLSPCSPVPVQVQTYLYKYKVFSLLSKIEQTCRFCHFFDFRTRIERRLYYIVAEFQQVHVNTTIVLKIPLPHPSGPFFSWGERSEGAIFIFAHYIYSIKFLLVLAVHSTIYILLSSALVHSRRLP